MCGAWVGSVQVEGWKRRGGKDKTDRYERNNISHVHSHESLAISLFNDIAREQLPTHVGGRSRNELDDDHVSLHEGAGIRGVFSHRRLVRIQTQKTFTHRHSDLRPEPTLRHLSAKNTKRIFQHAQTTRHTKYRAFVGNAEPHPRYIKRGRPRARDH